LIDASFGIGERRLIGAGEAKLLGEVFFRALRCGFLFFRDGGDGIGFTALMRAFEFIFWLGYAIYGFVLLTFLLFMNGGRWVLKEREDGFVSDIIQIEFLVLFSCLLFASSLRWCLDGGGRRGRVGKVKFSAFLLSVMMIVIGAGFLVGADGDLYAREFVLSFLALMSPLVVAMMFCYLRSRGESDEGGVAVAGVVVRVERLYFLMVSMVLFGVWNVFCWMRD
jgi:hypothetical protein